MALGHPILALEAGIVVASAGIAVAPGALAGQRSLVPRPWIAVARHRAVAIAVAGQRRRRAVVVRRTAIAPHLFAVGRHGLAPAMVVAITRRALVALVAAKPSVLLQALAAAMLVALAAAKPITLTRHGLAATMITLRALVAGALAPGDAGGIRVLAVLVQLGAGLMDLGVSAGALGLLAGGARGVLCAARLGVGDLGAGLAAAALLALLLGELLAAALLAALRRLAPARGNGDDQQDQYQYCRDGYGHDDCGAHGIPPRDRLCELIPKGDESDARPCAAWTILRCVLASASSMTIALIGLFGVVFPVIALGLIGFSVAQGIGERAENERRPNRWQRPSSGEDSS